MDRHQNGPSRRAVVGGLATGMAAAGLAGGSAAAQSEISPRPQGIPPNPDSEYPKPPFAKQQQEWPGLAGKMDPRPDHGEKSYRGSGRLMGRKALITGGDSGIGRAAPTRRWAAPASRPSWRRSTCCWHPANRATRPARSMARSADMGGRNLPSPNDEDLQRRAK